MTCLCPVDAWKAQNVNEKSGKRGIVFTPRDGFLDMPLQVPCGKCVGCKSDKSMYWSIRAYHESQMHQKNSFLTLTYNQENCPDELVKSDLQKFFKRLRHKYDFRYFACGEYGEQTARPHYHAIIFGESFRDCSYQLSTDLYSNPLLQEVWGMGQVAIAPVTMASCCYVAGYVHKKVGDEDTFSLMSRRPGIGHDWLDKYHPELLNRGYVVIEGKKLPIPLRYLAWMENEFSEIKAERAARFKQLSPDERWQKLEGLPHRKVNKLAQLQQRTKSI